MMVKVCGITRREDAEAVVEAGASAIGFIFVPRSPRYVTPERAAELAAGLPILKVGVFEEPQTPDIATIAATAGLDVAQIYGGSAPPGIRVWRAFRVQAGDRPEALGAEAVLFDGPANGVPFDWKLAAGAEFKLILAGGLNPSNVAEAIRAVRPWGVDASSGLEISPGVKDHAKVRAFVAAARGALGES